MAGPEKFIIRDERTPYQISAAAASDDFSHAVSVLPGIMLGSLFVPLLMLSASAFWLLVNGALVPIEENLVDFIGFLVTYLIGGIFLVAMMAAFSGFSAAILLTLFNWSMGQPVSKPSLIVLTGGLAGFLPFAVLVVPDFFFMGWSWEAAFFVVAVAWWSVLVCQVGAVWFYKKHSRLNRRAPEEDKVEFQFRIRHLMVITFWVGLMIAGSQLFMFLSGNAHPDPLTGLVAPILLVVWGGLQATTALARKLTRSLRGRDFPTPPKSMGSIEIRE